MSDSPSKKRLYSFIGLRLRALREENGLTQAETAALINKSHQTYSNYEKADNFITLDSLYTLANHYKISVKRLLPESDVLHDLPQALHPAENGSVFAEDANPFLPGNMTQAYLAQAEEAAALILAIKTADIREQILALMRTLMSGDI